MHYTLKLTPVGPIYRISRVFSLLCALFALFLGWALTIGISERDPLLSMLHIIILFILSVGGAAYRDTWLFDNEMAQIVEIWGFGPFVLRKPIMYEEIERLEVTHFRKGSTGDIPVIRRYRGRAMLTFAIRLESGQERSIQIIGERRSGGRVEEAARTIGAATGLSLYIDRPGGLDSDLGLHDL